LREAKVKAASNTFFANTVGILLILIGLVWFFQGINLLPGSFMTGQIQWAVYGGIAVIVGIVLLLWGKRVRRP
jgi:hypothetical protein